MIFPLLQSVTAAKTGDTLVAPDGRADRTYQATVTGTGAVTATVIVEGCNNNADWFTLGTITLSGTTSASDGFIGTAAWSNVRARLTAITGTGAAVSAQMGV